MKLVKDMTDDEILSELNFIDNVRKCNPENLLNDTFNFDIPVNYSVTARAEIFDNDKEGIFPTIIQYVFDLRAETRKEEKIINQKLEDKSLSKKDKKELEKQSIQLYNKQLAIKILLNSLYGATSNMYFRYYDERMAESTTRNGRLTIKWAEKTINNYLNNLLKTDKDYVIAIDTDSVYIDFSSLVDKLYNNLDTNKIVDILDIIANEKISNLLNDSFNELRNKLNSKQQKISMKREVISDGGIWTGKKHYILNVLDSEGVRYSEPKLKIVGIECVKSSTPKIIRDMIKDSIKIIMNTDEVTTQKYITECYEKFKTYAPEDIAFPRGVKNIHKYTGTSTLYTKGTPIHVRSAILYNMLLEKHELDTKYEKIKSGDSLKFIYLKTPNIIKENVIGFIEVLPNEFNLHQYIDYDTQFEKVFVAPIQSILDAIGWEWKSSKPKFNLNMFKKGK
jgi:DNA polymerase elongation subunit (family B)